MVGNVCELIERVCECGVFALLLHHVWFLEALLAGRHERREVGAEGSLRSVGETVGRLA